MSLPNNDATIGRFISPDTVIPDFKNLQAFNRYSYCSNNPLKYTDPSGHGDEEAVLAVVAGSAAIPGWGWIVTVGALAVLVMHIFYKISYL